MNDKNGAIILEHTPPFNRRCQITGMVVGPKAQRKTGYVVQYRTPNSRGSYFVATRKAAEDLRNKIVEKNER